MDLYKKNELLQRLINQLNISEQYDEITLIGNLLINQHPSLQISFLILAKNQPEDLIKQLKIEMDKQLYPNNKLNNSGNVNES